MKREKNKQGRKSKTKSQKNLKESQSNQKIAYKLRLGQTKNKKRKPTIKSRRKKLRPYRNNNSRNLSKDKYLFHLKRKRKRNKLLHNRSNNLKSRKISPKPESSLLFSKAKNKKLRRTSQYLLKVHMKTIALRNRIQSFYPGKKILKANLQSRQVRTKGAGKAVPARNKK